MRLRKTDFGLDSELTNLPRTAHSALLGDLQIDINQVALTLFGKAGNPEQPFLRNPTSCAEAITRFTATAYTDETVTGQASFTPTGCGNVPFSPELSAEIGSPGHTAPATKPPLTTTIEQDDGEAGLRRALVLLPPGITADAAQLGKVCPTPQFQASNCPPDTIIGRATAQSPLLAVPLSGDVSLVQPSTPGLPQLGVDLKGPLALQLRGSFVVTPTAGNVFEGLPDIPISRFELAFEPDKLVSSTRDLCVPPRPRLHADFDGHNGKKLSSDVDATVKGCGKAGKPTAKVKLSKSQSEHPRMKAKVKAGAEAPISQFKLKLPGQLRFATGSDFKRGAKASEGSKVGGGRRKVKVKSDEAAEKLKVRVKGQALDRIKDIKKGKKLRFPITVKDVNGKKTKIKARAKAR